ncbi:MAG TPA: DUF6174 domain-containing protein [Gemmatimonadaceae bacterium]|nr:DUF6174 domain-containing protein [Gemmatimonadaceae bacterium]
MKGLTRFCVATLFLVAGCGLFTGNDDEEARLRAAEVRWTRASVQDYQIVVQYLCFCGYTRPVRLTVRSGNVVSRVDAETGEAVPSYATHIADVAGLFQLIRDAIDDDAHILEASYDGNFGYPKFVNIDYVKNAVDDELQIRTSEFQPLR